MYRSTNYWSRRWITRRRRGRRRRRIMGPASFP